MRMVLLSARRISSSLSVDVLSVSEQYGITYLVANCGGVRRWTYSGEEMPFYSKLQNS